MSPIDLRGRASGCDAATLLSLSAGFVLSSLLHAAVELELFGALDENAIDLETLAQRLNASPRGLAHLLGALAPLGIVERLPDGRWRAAPIAAMLAPASPFARVLAHQHRHLYPLFHQLGRAVATGEPQPLPWNAGGDDGDLYGSLARRPEEFALFLDAMNAASLGVGELIATQAELGELTRLIDLGGGGGQVAVELLRAAPRLHVDLVDFPAACAHAQRVALEAGVGERLHAHPGDLFGAMPPLPPAGALLLSGVLGDFDAAARQRLLQRARELISPGGMLLVSETLLDDDRAGPLLPSLLALNMLLASRGGDNFTVPELRAMLERGGFTLTRVFYNGARGVRDLVVAHPR